MATASERVDMEYIFARDMLNVLIPRKVKNFQLEDTRHDLPTPFCFRIRNAVEHYVTNEDLNLYFAYTDFKSNLPDFKSLVLFQRQHVLPQIENLVALLKHLSVLSMMAAWYKKWGDNNAPAEALEEIRQILASFKNRYKGPENFWILLKTAAPFVTKRPLSTDENLFIKALKLMVLR